MKNLHRWCVVRSTEDPNGAGWSGPRGHPRNSRPTEKPTLPNDLAPEKNAGTKDAGLLREFLEGKFSVNYVSASLGDLNLDSGSLLAVNGKTYPCTQKVLDKMASSIKMPLGYAYSVGPELFKTNFDERKYIMNKAVQVCVVDGRAVGLADGSYRPARTIDVLDALARFDGGFLKLHNSTLSDGEIEINFLSDDFILEPQPGDEIRVGVRITNSETGGGGLKASLFTHRLVCSNGAVMSDSLGTARWSYDSRVTYGSSVAKFTSNLLRLSERKNVLRSLYATSMDRHLLTGELTRLWRRLRTAGNFTPDRADEILEVSREDRLRLQASLNDENAALAQMEPTYWNLFTIHNRITAAARPL